MRSLLFVTAFFLFQNLYGQRYLELMEQPEVPLSEIYAEYIEYVGDRNPYEVPGHKQFFRWYENAMIAAFPNNNLLELSEAFNDYALQRSFSSSSDLRAGGTWQSFGPQNAPIGGHNGKIDGMSFHPTDPNIIYISGSCGLWRTIDGGANWLPLTDNNAITYVPDVDIAPSNPDVIYYLAGGYYEYGAASLGVYKSIDGGANWNLTSFNYQSVGASFGRVLLVDPNDENIVYVAASTGVYKSTDGMSTFTQISSSTPREMYFNPLNSNKIYMVYNSIEYSEDAGATWTVSSGAPSGTKSIAVTAADTNVVYAVNTFGPGLEGIYKSTDGGANFSLQANSPNILGEGTSGNPLGGQGSYCLAMAVSPTDANKLFCGGIYLWTSSDGGLTWSADGSISQTHADIQEIKFHNGELWVGNDGGVFKSIDEGASWTYFQNMQTSLIYRIGLSEQNTDHFLTGWQDNGSSDYDGGTWEKKTGGDGFDCLVDYSDDNFTFTSYQYGNGMVSTDGQNYSTVFSSYGTGINSQGFFQTRVRQNRAIRDEYFVGKDKMYKSTDRMNTWTALAPIPYTTFWNKVYSFDVCDINDDYIYVHSVGEAFRTIDGGQSWTNITTGLDPDSAYIRDILVSPIDSLHIWVSKSGTNALSKVYESLDGGVTWINISAGLPNLPMNFLIDQKGTNDRIFVSCFAGVFSRDNDNPVWEEYGIGLPNATVNQMAIDYENGKFYAPTYGRGVWTNDLILDTISPIADFKAFGQEECGFGNGEVVFIDISDHTPTNWQWSFSGGSPATSNMPSPFVEYPATGFYPVQLIVSNAYGSDTLSMNLFVEKVNLPNANPPNQQEGFDNSASLPTYMSLDNPDGMVEWELEATVGGYNASNQSVKIDNFTTSNGGNHDGLEFGNYEFTQATVALITFDVACKSLNASQVDTLALMASIDCGASWNQVWVQNSNQMFAGTQFEPNYFVPQASDWKSYSVSLNTYLGSSHVLLKFENRSGNGNVMYLDNINLSAGNSFVPIAAYMSSNSSICEGDSIEFSQSASNFPNTWQWDFEGGDPLTSTLSSDWVTYNSAGVYDVQLVASNLNGSDTLFNADQITVYSLPNAPISASLNQLSTDPGMNYTWYWDGFVVSGANSNQLSVAQGGYYWVEVTDANGCTAISDSLYMSLADMNANELSVKVYPNPVSDVLNIELTGFGDESFTLVMTNALGEEIILKNDLKLNQKHTIQTQRFANGIYFLNILDSENISIYKQEIVVD